MIDPYLLVKWVHVLSATVLFGTGLGTAFYLFAAHRTQDPATIAAVARLVVRADWFFTGTSGIVQPISGLALAGLAGYDLLEPWLIASYALYLAAFLCWAPVVALQIRIRGLAEEAVASGKPLGPDYRRAFAWWFALGWPAFGALVMVFWLMVSKGTPFLG